MLCDYPACCRVHDGKTVRGAVRPDGTQVHLLSVFDVATGCVGAQREIDAKTMRS